MFWSSISGLPGTCPGSGSADALPPGRNRRLRAPPFRFGREKSTKAFGVQAGFSEAERRKHRRAGSSRACPEAGRGEDGDAGQEWRLKFQLWPPLPRRGSPGTARRGRPVLPITVAAPGATAPVRRKKCPPPASRRVSAWKP